MATKLSTDAGISISHLDLFSRDRPSSTHTSNNTPWFFNRPRILRFATELADPANAGADAGGTQ